MQLDFKNCEERRSFLSEFCIYKFIKGLGLLKYMNLEIDVSGEDLLSKDYTICIADNNGIIKGFKF